ncbi:hypothetical protein O6H91_11G019400 [Diphasiastrum complanatum]|uniref:Uncharacterized protein n=1 Tax=Diphasiastrum complanatum TaxID=34168 RepID=A0ACC2C6W5_DIPCM|nr:hypothetical protein O6H91_11G019400 [Diphasiastrum complanatum]
MMPCVRYDSSQMLCASLGFKPLLMKIAGPTPKGFETFRSRQVNVGTFHSKDGILSRRWIVLLTSDIAQEQAGQCRNFSLQGWYTFPPLDSAIDFRYCTCAMIDHHKSPSGIYSNKSHFLTM